MTKKLAIILGLTALLLLGIAGIKFPDIWQKKSGVVGMVEAAEETNITYRNMIEDFEKDPVWIDQPGPDGWFFADTPSL